MFTCLSLSQVAGWIVGDLSLFEILSQVETLVQVYMYMGIMIVLAGATSLGFEGA